MSSYLPPQVERSDFLLAFLVFVLGWALRARIASSHIIVPMFLLRANMFLGVTFPRRLVFASLLLLACSGVLGFVERSRGDGPASGMYLAVSTLIALTVPPPDPQSSYEAPNQHVMHPIQPPSPPSAPLGTSETRLLETYSTSKVLHELHSALSVMQTSYFSLWLGKWTTAIDWTAAVTGTHLTAALHTLSSSLSYTVPGTFDKTRPLDVEAQMVENEINKYFSQSITYFFGEDHFSIRMQAYDDMLWVVLGWLDSIRFIHMHSERHYVAATEHVKGQEEKEWHAKQFIPAFAHRARVFYELAEQGWDWRLCGGGMTWNPRLLPYKNAITNQLFIAASAAMYLYFPGDDNCSPFLGVQEAALHPDWKKLRAEEQGQSLDCDLSARTSMYDPLYLANAIHGYAWLKNVGMTNDQGLYVDGFHIRGYASNHSKTTCDERNEMVYTYNQGVILSGLRGLWEGTGNATYLEDGHELIRNVIRATGWTGSEIAPIVYFDPPVEPPSLMLNPNSKLKHKGNTKPNGWAGLGSKGILTELCDPFSTCSQDAQTFKGIFFHHLTAFCAPLPTIPVQPGKTYAASRELHALHRHSCDEYAPWVIHNGQVALKTKDREGKFGAWWGASLLSAKQIRKYLQRKRGGHESLLPKGAGDYRNDPLDIKLPKGEEAQVEIGADAMGKRQARMKGGGDLNDRGSRTHSGDAGWRCRGFEGYVGVFERL